MSDTTTELRWDPFDTEIDSDPYEIWRRLRDEAPLYRNDEYDFWALSRYADVEAAHRDPVTFCSGHGTVLEMMSPEPIPTGQMIFLDPPEHTRLRSLASRAFTPRRASQLEGRIRELCAEMLDPWVGGGSFDYVQDFGALLPSKVIAALLGVPPEETEEVRHHIDLVFHIEPGVGMINDISLDAGNVLNRYLHEQLLERARVTRDDMLTDLTVAEITEETGTVRKLTPGESTTFANLIISAGTETVARLLGNFAVVLAANPDQRAELAADAALIPNAVEELLRFEAPSPVQGRWTTREVELHGEVVPANSKVLLLTGAAGRDERKYPDPDRFDIHRAIDHHVAFGYGIHFCLGAALARLEGRIGIEETLRRYPTWEVDHARIVRLHTSTVRGYSKVPINVDAA
jgi:cytochrome P450